MWQPFAEHEFTKIPIVGAQNATLTAGDREDLLIGERVRVIGANTGGIVPKALQECRDSGFGALIQEELEPDYQIEPRA